MTSTVLVVDDTEQNLKLLEVKLFGEYYNVITASSGEQALEMLGSHSVDIVLLDIMMPKMDGFEVCKRIKSNLDTTHIPVVMVTALSDVEDKVRGLEAGADDFLTKPIDDTALFARIKSLTRMKTVIEELTLRNKISKDLGGSVMVPQNNFSDCSILLFDDDIAQVKNIKKNLSPLTAKIKVISSIEQIDSLIAPAPDVIIISCQVDVADPLRIGTIIKSKPLFSHSSTVLLAEEENMLTVIKGMELGVNDYFIYPLDQSELLARIKLQLRRKQYHDMLRHALETNMDLVTQDSLTNLFNRRYFDNHIKELMYGNKFTQKFCILLFDIDHFKQINDNFGHPVGDVVLKEIAAILKSLVRITDLIARYGGEEFVMIVNGTDAQQGQMLAEKIRYAIEKYKIIIKGVVLKCTISIGVTEYQLGESVAELIQRVDDALYLAKNNGRNQVAYLLHS